MRKLAPKICLVAALVVAAACGLDVVGTAEPATDAGAVDARSDVDVTLPPVEAGSRDGGELDAGSDAGTCFVPYGCTAYVCDDSDGGTQLTGATSAFGPRAGRDGGVDAGDAGANEAYVFKLGDLVLGSDPALPLGAAARTLSLWVQSTPTGGTQTIFNYGTFTTSQRNGLLINTQHDYFVGEFRDLGGTVVVTDGRWHHLAGAYDGNTMFLYVDGTLDVSGVPSGALDTVGSMFAIGQTVGASGREPFNGSISDIRVYNRVLSAAEIAQLASFNGQNNPESLRTTASGLVFWLPLFGSSDVMRHRCAP